VTTAAQRLNQHDREIATIRKLILQGMKMIVASQKEMRELRASQRETDRELKALIRSLRAGTNGHETGKIQ
jgi:hypothetical protein